MKTYLVTMRHPKGSFLRRRLYEAENPTQAIVKANNENKAAGWEVVAVYELIWHI